MKKLTLTLCIAAAGLVLVSCGNDAPKTDLSAQEQAAVDSTMANDQAAMDSLESAIQSQIGSDSAEAGAAEGHDHDHDHGDHKH
ncbi:MAG: hypothetical protein ACK5UI_09130 [Bacteroidota bacterium]|jgi:hypothetical protein